MSDCLSQAYVGGGRWDGERPCYLIFAARTTKIFRLWDRQFGQLVPLFHNCHKTVNQMDLGSVKETFGSLTIEVYSDTDKAL